MRRTTSLALGFAAGVIATALLAGAAWLSIVYTGAYNVAATDAHADPVRWTLDTTMRRSVSSRAEGLDLPEAFAPELIAGPWGARIAADGAVTTQSRERGQLP